VLSGLDRLIVSIDGATPRTYARYRRGGDFNRVMENLKLVLAKRRQLGRSNPYITWQFLVFRHNEHEIEDVRRIGRELGVDDVGITKAFIGDKDWMPRNPEYSNYRDAVKPGKHTADFFKGSPAGCSWLWTAVTVNPNGSVSPCCSVEDEKDDFGNIFRDGLEKVWNNTKYTNARRSVRGDRARGRTICSGCRHAGMTNTDIMTCRSLFTD
jgi:radical SAM protein with 4Fe4S-binding SPASM domain